VVKQMVGLQSEAALEAALKWITLVIRLELR
jgi:hypothetical protein